jgi:hypothetical protein
MPPQFSRTLKRKVRREFTEQIRFLVTQGVLSDEEGSTLQVAHDYRTPAFHRDDHNPKALQALACLLYAPLSTLFEKAAEAGRVCLIRSRTNSILVVERRRRESPERQQRTDHWARAEGICEKRQRNWMEEPFFVFVDRSWL